MTLPEIDPPARRDEADAVEDGDALDEPREQEAILRRVPRMEVFLGLGALAGLLLALALTFFVPAAAPEPGAKEFSTGQVFGFLAVVLIPVCLGISGLIGSLLGRGRGERVRLVRGDAQAPESAETDR